MTDIDQWTITNTVLSAQVAAPSARPAEAFEGIRFATRACHITAAAAIDVWQSDEADPVLGVRSTLITIEWLSWCQSRPTSTRDAWSVRTSHGLQLTSRPSPGSRQLRGPAWQRSRSTSSSSLARRLLTRSKPRPMHCLQGRPQQTNEETP